MLSPNPSAVPAPERRAKAARGSNSTGGDGILPTELLLDILLLLPAKDVCRLRLVCRSWRSLTFDLLFARAHSSRHPLMAVFHYRSQEIRFMDLSGNIVKRICTMQVRPGHDMSTELDLVCVSQYRGEACVLNPATGTVTVLPSDIAAKHDSKGSPILSTSVIGRIPSTGEYKVFRIHQYLTHNGAEQTCDIITLGSRGNGRWRARQCPPISVAESFLSRAIVDGVAYFLMDHYHSNTGRDSISSFDMATEEWSPMTLQGPLSSVLSSIDGKLEYGKHRIYFYLAELNDYLVCVSQICQDGLIDLWLLVDTDKCLWTKRYSLRLWDHCAYFRPLMLLDNGSIVLWTKEALRAFDPKTSTLTDLATIEYYFPVGIYRGSLLCSEPDLAL